MLPGYTQSAERAIKIAIKWAKKMGGMAAGTEHLLIGLAECDGTSADILKNAGLDRDKLLALVEDVFESKSELVTVDKGAMTPRADYVVKNALKEASFLGMKVAGTEHLLLAMIKQSDCIGVRVLNTLGVNVQKVFVVHGEESTAVSFAEHVQEVTGFSAIAPYSGDAYDLITGACVAEGDRKLSEKKSAKAKSAANTVFDRLVAAGARLVAVIQKCKGMSNKELGKFADQINGLADKWDR